MDITDVVIKVLETLNEKISKKGSSRCEKHGRTEEEEKTILRSHPLFIEIHSTDLMKVEQINVKDDIKKRMTIFYMKLLFSELDHVANALVDSYSTTSQNIVQVTDLLYHTVDNIRDTAVAGGVPPIFVEKFSPTLLTNVNIVSTTITDVHNTNQYTDTFSETLSVLDAMLLFTRFTMNNLETTVTNMNGELRHALEGSVFDTR